MNTFNILVLTSAAFVAMAAIPYARATEGLPADQHAAMSKELQQQAAIAEQKAAAHKVMARTGGSPKAAPGAMKRHCEQLAAQYRSEAARLSAQAAEHERNAGSVQLTREQHLALA